jgi:hypothetical protein
VRSSGESQFREGTTLVGIVISAIVRVCSGGAPRSSGRVE